MHRAQTYMLHRASKQQLLPLQHSPAQFQPLPLTFGLSRDPPATHVSSCAFPRLLPRGRSDPDLVLCESSVRGLWSCEPEQKPVHLAMRISWGLIAGFLKLSLAAGPWGAQGGSAGVGGPRQGAPAALSIVFTLLARHWVAGMGWVSARHWQDLEGKPALWEVCEGVDSWGASLHALAFSGQEEGMALHFNLRSKRGAPLLPPGLQQQCDCCQAWLARPANERAQRAQQLPAARAGTPEQCSSVGAVGVSGPLELITQIIMGQGARDDQAGEGLEKLWKGGRGFALVIYPFRQGEEQRWRGLSLSC